MGIKPKSKPRLTRDECEVLMKLNGLNHPDVYPLSVVGIRGYYLDSMGVKGENDRGMYDDAFFLISPDSFASFNANVDPSRVRNGWGVGAQKGMASLKKGLYKAHTFGYHKNLYLALVQRRGVVTVIRDGTPPYSDTGYFGINIHKGPENSTGSLGCTTIPASQWGGFINLAKSEAIKIWGPNYYKKKPTIPFLLIDEKDRRKK